MEGCFCSYWENLPNCKSYWENFENSGKSEAVAQRCSVKKGVLRNFTKFTGKHLCQSLFFNKIDNLIKFEFSVNFAKILRTPFFTENPRWLLLESLSISMLLIIFDVILSNDMIDYVCWKMKLVATCAMRVTGNIPV